MTKLPRAARDKARMKKNLSDTAIRLPAMHAIEDLEGIARDIHHATGGLLPVDAFELAELCGLRLVPWYRSYGAIRGDEIFYPIRARLQRQHGIIAHEIGHFALERAGLDPRCEPSARYLAGALLLPQTPFFRDAMELDFDLPLIQTRHPNASAEMIAVRLTQVAPAVAWIWDNGKLARQYGVDEGDVEDLVDRVLTAEEPVSDGDLDAWPIFDGQWRRVIVVRRCA